MQTFFPAHAQQGQKYATGGNNLSAFFSALMYVPGVLCINCHGDVAACRRSNHQAGVYVSIK